MGRLIDFNYKNNKKQKTEIQSINLVSLLPRLSLLKNETIVIYIDKSIINNKILLNDLLQGIITLRCMEAMVVIVPDVDKEITDYCNENFGTSNPFASNDSVDLCGHNDIFDVIVKNEVINNIVNIIRKFNAKSLAISGSDLDIIFPDEVASKNVSDFITHHRGMYDWHMKTQRKKYSIDLLNELLKTSIIPVLIPSFKDRISRNFVMESALFASYIARYSSALKYISAYTDNNEIPSSCIYGVEKFAKMIAENSYDFKTQKIINANIEAVKNGVQSVHIIDLEKVNLLEELCISNFKGLFLYDDSLNQL